MTKPQKDLVTEARELLASGITEGPFHVMSGGLLVAERTGIAIAKFLDRGTETPNPQANAQLFARAPELLRQLCDEVERLREQWNTRFNTLCGNCGKRFLGPRDEHLHGFGKCEELP